ncbi:MAG TPA: hypothetical protein VGM26_00935 [Rhizomicrobium sp.]|jgi:hypothetical protein
MTTKRAPEHEPVEFEFKGSKYKGTYTLSTGMVHVSSVYGRKSILRSELSAHALASTLLKEIIQEASAAGKI